jgi:hypothetical protein
LEYSVWQHVRPAAHAVLVAFTHAVASAATAAELIAMAATNTTIDFIVNRNPRRTEPLCVKPQ